MPGTSASRPLLAAWFLSSKTVTRPTAAASVFCVRLRSMRRCRSRSTPPYRHMTMIDVPQIQLMMAQRLQRARESATALSEDNAALMQRWRDKNPAEAREPGVGLCMRQDMKNSAINGLRFRVADFFYAACTKARPSPVSGTHLAPPFSADHWRRIRKRIVPLIRIASERSERISP